MLARKRSQAKIKTKLCFITKLKIHKRLIRIPNLLLKLATDIKIAEIGKVLKLQPNLLLVRMNKKQQKQTLMLNSR